MTGYAVLAAADAPLTAAARDALAVAIEAATGAVVTIEPRPFGAIAIVATRSADRAGAVALRLTLRAALPSFDLAVRARPVTAPALAVFDMDSTLLSIEVIDELARRHGVGAEVAAITERAMRGELDFEASLRARVRRLAGLPAAALDDLAATLPLSPGAAALIAALRARGCVCAIASGGFTFASDALVRALGFEHAHANTLEIADGVLTGAVVGAVITAERKAAVLRELAARHRVAPAATLAVGDGANDRLLLAAAGFGVAYRAKPALAAVADGAIDHGGLDRVLAFLDG